MKIRNTAVCLLTVALVNFGGMESAEAARFKACIDSTGKILILRNCKAAKGQFEFNLNVIAISSQGMKGDPGPAGPPGPQGEPGISGRIVRTNETLVSFEGPGYQKEVNALCSEGEVALGGGCSNDSGDLVISRTLPFDGGWHCAYRNQAKGQLQALLIATAVCGKTAQ